MESHEKRTLIVNELFQVLLKHNISVAEAIDYLEDTKNAVQIAGQLSDLHFEYDFWGSFKTSSQKEH